MIKITFNGNFLKIPNFTTIDELANIKGYKNPFMVKVNDKKLQLFQYKKYKINDGDNIVIKRILGGG